MQGDVGDGPRNLTTEEVALLEEGGRLVAELHLDIESFYLFAKILLDNVAHAIEFYFGPARSCSMDSHDVWVKGLDRYPAAQELKPISDRMRVLATELKADVSDYRDYQIAYEKSPRTMKATMFSLDGADVRIVNTRLYPTERDVNTESKPPSTMIGVIDEYIDELILFIESNRDRTVLPLEEPKNP